MILRTCQINSIKQHLSRPRSYVRRGRITASQRQALEQHKDQVVLPANQKLSAVQSFTRQPQHLCMEIGFGMGENLLAMAAEHPEVDFLGIEVHTPGTGLVIREVQKLGLTNLRLYHHDVVDLLRRCISKNSIDSCFILFPDPWPKRKHHKRRLIQPDFVDLLWQTLAYKAIVWIATDWPEYAEHIVDVFSADGRWCGTYPDAALLKRKKTRFEYKGTTSQHSITDLLWQKA